MSPFEVIISCVIAFYLRDILDGMIFGIYKAITGKDYKEVIIKWSKNQ